jgi:hypothetical protein
MGLRASIARHDDIVFQSINEAEKKTLVSSDQKYPFVPREKIFYKL